MVTVNELTSQAIQQLRDSYNVAIKYIPTPVYNINGYDAKGDKTTDDTAAIQIALNDIFALGKKAIIDFSGGEYLVTAPIEIPVGNDITFRNGKIFAAGSFPTSEYLFKTGTKGTQFDGFANSRLIFEDMTFDSSHRGGGLLLDKYIEVIVSKCHFLHYSTDGLKVTGSSSHECLVDSSFFAEYLYLEVGYNDPAVYTGTGISLSCNDNHVTNCVIKYCKTGIAINNQYNLISGTHIYTGGSTGIYIKSTAAHSSLNQMYMDGAPIIIENPFSTEITNSKFLAVVSDPSFSFITLKPLTVGLYVTGFKVNNCAFHNSLAVNVNAVKVDNSLGSLNGGQVRGCSIEANSFLNVNPCYTRISKGVYRTGVTVFTYDFAALLPLGNIQKVLYSLRPDSATVFTLTNISNVSGTSVTVSTNGTPFNGTVYFDVDVNND